jgi:hypothetical protein
VNEEIEEEEEEEGRKNVYSKLTRGGLRRVHATPA